MIEGLFATVLAGTNYQVIAVPHPFLLIFVQNVDGRGALRLRLSLRPGEVVEDGRGFNVRVDRSGAEQYIRIESREPGAPPVFMKLVEYVLDQLQAVDSPSSATRALRGALDEFRRFSSRRSGRLSEDEVRGLVAELLLIENLVEAGTDLSVAVAAWKGPFARDGVGSHDFTFADGRAIEVKSTHQPPEEVHVASPDQLRPSESRLDLAVLPLEAVPPTVSGAISFVALVRRLDGAISGEGGQTRGTWQRALESLHLDIEDEYYDQWVFVPGRWRRYVVREGFPSIPSNAMQRGIVKVRYSLELKELEEFEVDFDSLAREGAS